RSALMARSIVKKVTSLQSYKRGSPRRFSTAQRCNLVTHLTFLTLHPLRHLFGKWALCAIGVVLHAKIFVNLKQTLLVRDGFQKLLPPRIISEKARSGRFQAAVR